MVCQSGQFLAFDATGIIVCVNFLQVFDQYLNFISLEEDLFTVKHHDRDSISYYGELYD